MFTCIQLPIAALAQPATRSNYESLTSNSSLQNAKLPFLIPKISHQNSLAAIENLKAEKAMEFGGISHARTAVIMHTVVGLADDSMAGIRHRIELAFRQNKWEIVWVGRQSQCQPNRGQQNWATGSCR